MGRWHREGYKCLRHLALGMLLTSVLLYNCFCGSSVQCEAKEENTGQNIELDGETESVRYEGSTEVTAYVSMEPEQPSERPDDSKPSDTDGGNTGDGKVKTGDDNKVIYLLYIVIGSFIIIMCGILRPHVDNFKKKSYESGKE